jgi:release factor glutamine methyltransferase
LELVFWNLELDYMTISDAINFGFKKLNNSTSPHLDAEVLLCFVLKKDKAFIFSHPKYVLPKQQSLKFTNLIKKAQKGIPIAYLVGHKEFFGLDFAVSRNTLIPRPETEILVETIMARNLLIGKRFNILDIGTGSGAIIISLAKFLNNNKFKFYASDISSSALQIARKNANKHKVRIAFKQGSLLEPWKSHSLNLIVANLPYLTAQSDRSIRFEPTQALIAGNKGLALFEQLFKQISELTKKPHSIILEIGSDQKNKIKKLAKKVLPEYKVDFISDLSKRVRVAVLDRAKLDEA